MKLRPYQQQSIENVHKSFSRGNKRTILQLATAGGKCLGKNTPVLMFDGSIKMVQDIVVGDQLMGVDSTPRNVLSLARGREMLYKVKQIKGDDYVVNESHILSLKKTSNKPCKDRDTVNISLTDYIKTNKNFKHLHKGWKTAIDFEKKKLKTRIDPYMLGLWLGDGHSNKFTITTMCKSAIKSIYEFAEKTGSRVTVDDYEDNKSSGYSVVGAKKPIVHDLRELGVCNNKHIPDEYLKTDRDSRLEILAGILDADGHHSKSGFDITLKNERLMDDLIYLARSLGFYCSKSKQKKGIKSIGFMGEYFRTYISGDFSCVPFRRPEHVDGFRERKQIKDVLVTGFSLEKLDIGDYYGFEIDGDRLFLLGDFTVTHNTVLASTIIGRAIEKGSRVIVFVPRRELAYQFQSTLDKVGIDAGLIMAEEPRKKSNVQVASFDTFASWVDRKANMFAPEAQLVIVDEAHIYLDKQINLLGKYYPNAHIIGLTATPARKSGTGLGNFYQDMVLGVSIKELTDQGFLAPVRYYAPSTPDLSKIKTDNNGDYREGQLDSLMSDSKLVGNIVENWSRIAHDRQTVVFCSGIKHSIHVRDEFLKYGIKAEHIDGNTDKEERERILERLRTGETQVLTNVFVATYGLDIPVLSCAVMARPTKNLALYLQMVGRVMRLHEGKTDAIVIDHAGVVAENGFVADDQYWSLDTTKKIKDVKAAKEREKKEKKQIECQNCKSLYKAEKQCPYCGHEWELWGEEVPYIEADLEEMNPKKENRTQTWDYKIEFIGGLKKHARNKGFKYGWVAHTYREKFGVFPNDKRVKDAPVCDINIDVIGFIKHLNIKRARGRR